MPRALSAGDQIGNFSLYRRDPGRAKDERWLGDQKVKPLANESFSLFFKAREAGCEPPKVTAYRKEPRGLALNGVGT